MTSNDTLGPGISGNVSTILPSVGLNGTIPDDGNYVPRPWKSRVTTVEAGIGTPNASPAITATYTPQQIADFLTRYVLPPPSGPEWKNAFVRDSAAGAGVASRNNVFEYGYPEPGATGPHDELSPFARTWKSDVGTIGPATAPPIRYLSSRNANPLGDGMGDWKSAAESYPRQPAQPVISTQESGGLLGLIQDYMRNNSDAYR